MILASEAVAAAQQAMYQFYEQALEIRPPGQQLEEVYLSDDESSWFVTLSYISEVEPDEPTGLGALLPPKDSNGDKLRKRRVYKTFEIDSESGSFLGMKIRPVASA